MELPLPRTRPAARPAWIARSLIIGIAVAPVALIVGVGSIDPPTEVIHTPTDGLGPVPFPQENPFSEEKRVLGKILFWDEQLSSDNTVACGTCHMAEFSTSDPRAVLHPGVDGVFGNADDILASPGVSKQGPDGRYQNDPHFGFEPQVTRRSTQSVINSGHMPLQFWDGRAGEEFIDPMTGQVAVATGGALESQAVGPILSDVEMATQGRTWQQVVDKLKASAPLALATDVPPDLVSALQASPTYPKLFQAAFGDPAINSQRIAFALATYQRTLVADDTDWDRWQAGDPNAMTAQEIQGFFKFLAKNCSICHQAPLFQEMTFRNIGLRPATDDTGRFEVTGNPADIGRFKAPTLRNVSLKTTFMHTGQFSTLADAVDFYRDVSQQFPDNRDGLIPIQLNQTEFADILAFIGGALLDERVANRQFPFDRPTLFTQRPNVNLEPIGVGLPGTGGNEPAWIAAVPPNIGNVDFKVGVRGARAGALATLRVSPLPPINNIVSPDEVLGPIMLDATGGPADGFGTMFRPIEPDPALNGQVLYMQWFVDDPQSPGGQARSRPLRVTMFCGPLGCPDFCPADCDGNGTLTILDYICFGSAYTQQLPAADCDQNGLWNIFDYICFGQQYAAGCP